MNDLLTTKQVAEQYGVTPRTVRNWITQGRLTAYKRCGHVLMVDARSLDNLLAIVVNV
jgi:excisionase family DNA binding protein